MTGYEVYSHLIDRCGDWDFNDLGDLLLEVRRDPELSDDERHRLLEAVYLLIWQRAEPLLRRWRTEADSSPGAGHSSSVHGGDKDRQ